MDDRARVAQLLGREPNSAFDVVVRDHDGDPVVVRNAPFLDDGTPMPTRFYLVGADLVTRVSRLEAAGGVRQAEAEIDADEIARVHERYAAERDAVIDADHVGPRPHGGVGGTRTGVKCLHAHLAYCLAGGDDPIGRWTIAHLQLNPDPGGMTLRIDDHTVTVTMTGADKTGADRTGAPLPGAPLPGMEFHLPIGPSTLLDGPLERADPPSPAHLTNALGLVTDHLDDVLIAAPAMADPTSVVAVGDHALALARVEIGHTLVPADYELRRADADEVFRTLVAETKDDRRHNPGLDHHHVESIIGTCCVILGVMRRLDLASIRIGPPIDAIVAPTADATVGAGAGR
jgi:uncharacterized protein